MGSGARKHSIPTYGAMILHSSMKVVAIDASNGDGLSLSYEVVVVAMVEREVHSSHFIFTHDQSSSTVR